MATVRRAQSKIFLTTSKGNADKQLYIVLVIIIMSQKDLLYVKGGKKGYRVLDGSEGCSKRHKKANVEETYLLIGLRNILRTRLKFNCKAERHRRRKKEKNEKE